MTLGCGHACPTLPSNHFSLVYDQKPLITNVTSQWCRKPKELATASTLPSFSSFSLRASKKKFRGVSYPLTENLWWILQCLSLMHVTLIFFSLFCHHKDGKIGELHYSFGVPLKYVEYLVCLVSSSYPITLCLDITTNGTIWFLVYLKHPFTSWQRGAMLLCLILTTPFSFTIPQKSNYLCDANSTKNLGLTRRPRKIQIAYKEISFLG